MPIREATLDDLDPVMELMYMFYTEDSHFSKFEFDAEQLALTIIRGIESSQSLTLVAFSGDRLAGCLCAHAKKYPHSNSLQVIEEVFYIHPEFRGTIYGGALIKRLTAWGTSLGADVYFNARAQVNLMGLWRMLKAFGFRRLGFISVRLARK